MCNNLLGLYYNKNQQQLSMVASRKHFQDIGLWFIGFRVYSRRVMQPLPEKRFSGPLCHTIMGSSFTATPRRGQISWRTSYWSCQYLGAYCKSCMTLSASYIRKYCKILKFRHAGFEYQQYIDAFLLWLLGWSWTLSPRLSSSGASMFRILSFVITIAVANVFWFSL